MASSFESEPITVRRTVSASLLRETRERASVRPTTPVPAPWPAEEPVISVVEEQELDADDAQVATLFEVREINASRGYDPRSE